jgi:hypothetical protein
MINRIGKIENRPIFFNIFLEDRLLSQKQPLL